MVEIMERNMWSYLERLVKSRINITPDALLFLEEAQPQDRSFSDLIVSLSYSQDFNSHLTLNDITKTIKEKPEMEKYFTNKAQLERCILISAEKKPVTTQSSHPSKTQQVSQPKQPKQPSTQSSQPSASEVKQQAKETTPQSENSMQSIMSQIEFELNDKNFMEDGKFKQKAAIKKKKPEKNVQPKTSTPKEEPDSKGTHNTNTKSNSNGNASASANVNTKPIPKKVTDTKPNKSAKTDGKSTGSANKNVDNKSSSETKEVVMKIDQILDINPNDDFEADSTNQQNVNNNHGNKEMSITDRLKAKLSYLNEQSSEGYGYDPDSDDYGSESEDESDEDSETPNVKQIRNFQGGSKDEILGIGDFKQKDDIKDEKAKYFEAAVSKIRSSYSTFNPTAKDYDKEIEVLKDPSLKLFTDGKIEDFHAVAIDKFNKLKKILLQRPDCADAQTIYQINRSSQETEVKVIGMVMDKRVANSGTIIITLEDPSSTIKVIIRNTKQNEELLNKGIYILEDAVIFIEGFLQVNKYDKTKVIFANNIEFPDLESNRNINFPDVDLSVCCLSDIHFGSTQHMGHLWDRFVSLLKGDLGSEEQRKWAGSIKYITIAGDLVDGIGIYPGQEKNLTHIDIYDQYKFCAEQLARLPDYVEIVFVPGDHDAVRKALPSPKLDKDLVQPLMDLGNVTCLGAPATVSLHGIKTLIYHGESMIDINMLPGMSNENIPKTMKLMIENRHLAPSFGKKTQIAPCMEDHLVIDIIPDIFHTGHLHKIGYSEYKRIAMVNGGCFQEQTDFMASLGIVPDCGKIPIINIKGPNYKPKIIDLEQE